MPGDLDPADLRVEGPRVRLREWRPDEGDAFFAWAAAPPVRRFLAWAPRDRAASDRQLAEAVAARAEAPRTRFFLAVERLEDGALIGDAGFTRTTPEVAEIGYFLIPAYWGQGYAREAAGLAMAAAFALGAREVVAGCDARNTRSERVMRALGMAPVEAAPGRRRYRRVR